MEFNTDTPKFIRALAEAGYAALINSPAARDLSRPIAPQRYDEDADDQIDLLDDPGYQLSCCDFDRQLIAIADSTLVARVKKDGLTICGLEISWARKMARLKTWGGQQTLSDIMADRLHALRLWRGIAGKKKKQGRPAKQIAGEPIEQSPTKEADAPWKSVPAIQFESALSGVSGLMPGHSQINGIDLGFSPNGVKINLNPWLEILVIVGVQFSPITILPPGEHDYGRFAVYRDGLWYPFFKRSRIEEYYFAWDVTDDRGLLPHQFAKWIDPEFSPQPFDDLQIPLYLLNTPDILWNEIERLKRIAARDDRAVMA